jgi:nitrogenase molybdenum-iron protein NifN
VGAFQDGWAAAVKALVRPAGAGRPRVRPHRRAAGRHLTPGDLEELRELIEAFGLTR